MLTRGEGFQASLPLAGLSVQRSYGLLQPYHSVRPTGRQSFFLLRPSTVEVMVNGQLMRRVRLDPAPYDHTDFPTGFGANAVRLNTFPPTRNTTTHSLHLFFTPNQLTEGHRQFPS